jgi:methylated-DNA-[protein]-cysteine S-methyltransferase
VTSRFVSLNRLSYMNTNTSQSLPIDQRSQVARSIDAESSSSAWTICESPLGPLTLVGSSAGLSALHFPGHSGPLDEVDHDRELFDAAIGQLEEYFHGRRYEFDLRLDLNGTPFQRRVWAELSAIPYGSTRSYGQLAGAIGRLDRSRAVGAAVGRVPVPIIIPCHRAVGANGDLTGYRGGLQRKRSLLELEAAVSRTTARYSGPPDAPTGLAARRLIGFTTTP